MKYCYICNEEMDGTIWVCRPCVDKHGLHGEPVWKRWLDLPERHYQSDVVPTWVHTEFGSKAPKPYDSEMELDEGI